MQKSIALALLFGSSSATVTTPGPQPELTEHRIEFATGSYDLGSSLDAVVDKSKSVTSGGLKAGLSGCLRSGMVPMATQGFFKGQITLADDSIVLVDQASTIRTFYQTTQVMQGEIASIATGDIFQKYDAKVADADTPAEIIALQAMDNSYFECCAPGITSSNEASCPSAYSLKFTDVGTSGSFNTLTVEGLMPNRLNFYNNIGNTDGPAGTNQQEIYFNQDFILGAMAQLSDEVGDEVNWCSMNFKTEITDTATYSANTGFNSNTKCSWQVSAEATKAPQFAVASTTTSTENLIQWIEWSSDANGGAGFRDGSILRAVQELAEVVTNFGIGNYPLTDGVFFNPFAANALTAMTYDQDSPAYSLFDDDDTGFEYYTYSQKIAGSPGNARFWPNSEDNLEYKQALQTTFDLDMGIFTTALAYAMPAYASYDSALTTFNTDAAAYNDAVAAYNTALTDTPKELPVVMERPCPPTKPAAIAGVEFIMDDTVDVAAEIVDAPTAIVQYIQQNGDTTKINDAKRYGYVMSAADYQFDDLVDFDADTAFAGHVFGRLGQGKMNMPGTLSPWKWETDEDSIQWMMISIFPDNGEDYGTAGALAEGQTIDIEISSAALSITDGFEMPSASATAALALTDKDAAQALVFSAVALAAAVASLY